MSSLIFSVKTVLISFVLIVPVTVFAGGSYPVRKAPEEYLVKRNPFAASDKSSLERGTYIFSGKCARCHGKNGDGAGSILEGYTMPVFNKEFFSKRVDGYIFWIVEYGIPDTPMRAYGPGSDHNLSAADVWKTITFVRMQFSK